MNKRILIIDCNYLCYRALYSTGELSHDGAKTGTFFGFFKEVVNLTHLFKTPHIVFCWDYGLNKRYQIYPKYKEKRKETKENYTKEEKRIFRAFNKQVKYIREVALPKIGYINNFYQKGYESDDMIASVCNHFNIWSKPWSTIIVTADHDLFQLINKHTSVYNPHKKERLTRLRFKKRYGISPKKWVEVKSMAGCSSDNIKGIEGIGEKTAIKYLLGQLKESSVACKKIESKKGQRIIKKNKKITKLPLEGVQDFTLLPDHFEKREWTRQMKKHGVRTLSKYLPLNIES
jgi:DNA polymerase-1